MLMLVDVGLCSGRARAGTHGAARDEADEEASYGPGMPAGWAIIPCARGMQTEAGPRAREFSTHLARALAMKANGGTTPTTKLIALKLKDVEERIGCANMRTTKRR